MRVANKGCFIVEELKNIKALSIYIKTWITCHFDGTLLKKDYLNDK